MENINKFEKWHESGKIEEGGVIYFLKKYTPNSYELKNELSWLTSTMINSCRSFKVPEVISASVHEGYIKMENIDLISNINKDEIIKKLVMAAGELHNMLKFNNPITRNPVNKSGYRDYLHNFTKDRFAVTLKENPELEKIQSWLFQKIDELHINYFSIVHRDLRLRHLISDTKNDYLIDWEFSNISDFGQDLAKLIYDCVVNHDMEKDEVFRKVVSYYSEATKLSKDEVINKINTFLPIMPLEHASAFIRRSPDGYESEVSKDVAFILALYDKEK